MRTLLGPPVEWSQIKNLSLFIAIFKTISPSGALLPEEQKNPCKITGVDFISELIRSFCYLQKSTTLLVAACSFLKTSALLKSAMAASSSPNLSYASLLKK